MTKANYWLVGANWEGDDQQDAFYRRGYWEMGYSDKDKPNYAKKRDGMKEGDRVGIKSMDGKGATTITIHAIGIVKEVDAGKVFIDWIIKDMNRKVPSKGAFGTIHGEFEFSDPWTREVFCL